MRNRLIFILFCLVFITRVSSQTFIRGEKTMTLEDCIKTGLTNNRTLISSNYKIENANAKLTEARSGQYPQLKFTGSFARLSEVPEFIISLPVPGMKPIDVFPSIPNNYNLKLNVQQPLFTGFRIQSSKEMAEYNALSMEEDFKKDKSEIIYYITSAYWNFQKTLKIVELLTESLKLTQSHLADITNFFKQGTAAKNDVLKIEVQVYNVKASLVEAGNALNLAKANLCNIMGIDIFSEVTFEESDPTDVFEIKKLEDYINNAMKMRHEVKSIQYKVQMGDAGLSLAKSSWFPQIILSANYTYANPNQRVMPQVAEFKDTWDVGVGISFDIWNWGANSSKVEQARSQLSDIQNGFEQIKELITLEVYQSYLNLVQTKEKLEFTKKAVEQSEENYRISKEKFGRGLLSNSDLLDAENSLLQVKTNHMNTTIDLSIAYAKLVKAVGN